MHFYFLSWKRQLDELAKLPVFLRPQSPKDLLSAYPNAILGVNTAQLYLKVPGCRTTGHQENSNLCSINLNIGPGDCRWFAVAHEHWPEIDALCRRYRRIKQSNKLINYCRDGLDYVKDSWWPNVGDLQVSGIPYTEFVQRPGEIVFVSCGTVHWVESIV